MEFLSDNVIIIFVKWMRCRIRSLLSFSKVDVDVENFKLSRGGNKS